MYLLSIQVVSILVVKTSYETFKHLVFIIKKSFMFFFLLMQQSIALPKLLGCWSEAQRGLPQTSKMERRFVNIISKRIGLSGVLRRYRTTKTREKLLINVNNGINSLTEFSNLKHDLAPEEFHLNNNMLMHIKLMHIKLRCILLRQPSIIILNALSLETKTRQK